MMWPDGFLHEYLQWAYRAARHEALNTRDWSKAMHIEVCLHFMEGDSPWHRKQERERVVSTNY